MAQYYGFSLPHNGRLRLAASGVNTAGTGQIRQLAADAGHTSVVHNCSTKLVTAYPVPFCD
jgi:hypothetical protein